MDGIELIRLIASATGLPKENIESTLTQLALEKGYNAENLTLEQVRKILADYLQDTLIQASKTYSRAD